MLERCVRDVEAFARAWGNQPLHIVHADDSAFADVLDLCAVDEFLASVPRPPAVRLVEHGKPLPPSRYCRRLRLGGRQLDDVVDAAKVAACLRDGATAVLQSLHRTWPPVGRFVGELQDEIGHPVQANAYLTPPGAAGLAPHEDGHDVLVLQLHGSKSWNVVGLGDVDLHPGDVMYVPAHTRHSARTNDESSLHLTLGIIRVRLRDIVTRILDADDALDAPVPIGFRSTNPSHLASLVATSIARARQTLSDADADHVASAEQERRLSRPYRPGRVMSLLAAPTITSDARLTWVVPRVRVRPAGSEPGSTSWRPLRSITGSADLGVDDDGRFELDLGDRVLSLPGVAVAAVCRLYGGCAVPVAELPGLDDPSRIVLARRLVEEAACVIDPVV